MKPTEYEISSEKFVFVNSEGKLHDKELSTKPVSYLQDAFHRFTKNKASIVAACIIIFLIMFAIVGPWLTPYEVSYRDTYYQRILPKIGLSEKLGWNFWDGCENVKKNEADFMYFLAIKEETGNQVFKNGEYETYVEVKNGVESNVYEFRLDTYEKVGCQYIQISEYDFEQLQNYQDRTGIQVVYPNIKYFDTRVLNGTNNTIATQDINDANYWYKTQIQEGKTRPVLSEDGQLIRNYAEYTGNDQYNSIRIEGEIPLYNYSRKLDYGYEIRVDYKQYYIYMHNHVLKDGIENANFIFGTTANGQDIFSALSSGARFSLILAVIVASVNLFVGAIYGAIEGYYGGKLDLIMERIVEILSSIPFMIVITLLKYHMKGSSQILILFISFFLTGWIGMAGRTRMQFYRFKNQEYVLAARTLGASDARIMFKHIFPNALGTLITSCVLVIPGVIFSETSLSYLGIINLDTGDLSSVGTLLAAGRSYLMSYPHMVLFPSIFICLLMLSFNLFGNGLRDAFNPSLRGSED